MKKITFLLAFLISSVAFSQVGINTTTPSPASALEISSFNEVKILEALCLPV